MAYPYSDFRDYLDGLRSQGLLVEIADAISKDTELVPLVRLQFRGLPSAQRKAFLFNQVTDSRMRSFDASVAIAALAASPAVYACALGTDLENVAQTWQDAFANPIEPRLTDSAACKERVAIGQAALDESCGVDGFPHPISTPGFDNAPFITSGYWVSKDPLDGTYNVGVYRGMIKGSCRVGLQMDTPSQHIAIQLAKAKQVGRPLQAAIVIGTVPALGFASAQKLPYGLSEYAIAGGLMGRPVDVVRCETVDLEVPAHAELVIEGEIDPAKLEPEGPFGEASGYMGWRTKSPTLDVTAITHRDRPIIQAFISEFPPSESTLMRKIGFENVYRRFLRQSCNIASVEDVCFYEMATCNMMFVVRLRDPTPGQAWQALYAASGYEPSMGKIILAVDSDIDVSDVESLIWALAFRVQPRQDVCILDNKLPRLDPSIPPDGNEAQASASALLVDATRPRAYPPISLPSQPNMENALQLWEKLGLPSLNLKRPWHGYELGDWSEANRKEAALAEVGRYLETGLKLSI
jgi:UbiD family decarboxylase